MKTFSGRKPFSCWYFLMAFTMAGRMETAISSPDSWSSQLLVNLGKVEMKRKTNTPSNN